MQIGILDYGFGNIRSVWNAVYSLGYDPDFIKSPTDFQNCSHLIIPGVGAFDAAMDEIYKRDLYVPIRSFAKTGKPILGICLGMQLLASTGTEGRNCEGLDLIPAVVDHFPSDNKLLIPHCGWNSVQWTKPHPLTKGLPETVDYYFVHSYIKKTHLESACLGITQYGDWFCSASAKENIIGLQFHPEKSQRNGLKILENFCSWSV